MNSIKTLQTTPAVNDVVTIIRDPKNALGKRFAADGSKTANVQVSLALAVQRHVPTLGAMGEVIKEVSEDTNAALINASFPEIPVGEDFVILSEKQFTEQLGLSDRSKMLGVHDIKVGRRTLRAIGRFKENTKASSWQILDRDIDSHTPPEFANLSHTEWLEKVELLLPGLSDASRISTLSSSARVMKNGKAIGNGNGHTWVQVQDPTDVERVRTALQIKAMELGLAWKKPRFSKAEPGKIVCFGFATILDPSVWTPGRLVFNGKPTVGKGLTVRRQAVKIVAGTRLDTSRLTIPSAKNAQAIARAAGFEQQLHSGDGGSLAIHANDLSLDTEIELRDGSTTTVREALERLPDGEKLRCQTPFRESTSEAGFLTRARNGKPFLHDVGTSTTHWLTDLEAVSLGHQPLSTDGLPFGDVFTHLKTLPNDDLLQQWARVSFHLPAHELEQIMEFVQNQTSIARRVLNATLKEAAKSRKASQVQDRAGDREVIFYTPEDLTQLTTKAERLILGSVAETEFMSFGGVLSQLLDQEIPYTHAIGDAGGDPPKVPVLEPLDQYGIRALVERVAVFQGQTQSGLKNIAVPLKLIETMICKKVHGAPVVTGLVTHPIVLADGTIVAAEGLHRRSGLLLHGSSIPGARPYSQSEARTALTRLADDFLDGFEFESGTDAAVALSALFTGVVRRILDQAPGYVFLAPIQSSGKTTLARRIHVTLTGRDMPVSNFAAGDEQEMQKRMLSMLMSSPAMVCLDNVTDGTTFSSSAISMAMTSPVLKQRVLGISKDAECPTNVLFVATGNNLSLGADELTRWLPAYLNPRTSRPQERTFTHPDVVSHALHIRAKLLRDVIGIIAGYIASGATMATNSRFTRWDRMVRQPMIWAGGIDVADVFRANTDNSEANGAAEALLTSAQTLYGKASFSASNITSRFTNNHNDPNLAAINNLREALISMRCKDPKSDSSVGRALKSIVNRRVPTINGDLTLKSRMLNGLTRYTVV